MQALGLRARLLQLCRLFSLLNTSDIHKAFQKKWAMLKTYRRIRKLWNEYKQVAEIQ